MTSYQEKDRGDMEDIFLEIDNDIGTIYLNRPEKRNALSYDMWTAVPELIKQCEENRHVKVIRFKSVDPTAFSSGADISEFPTWRSTRERSDQYTQATLIAEEAIMKATKPTIAQIQGFCVGGGCEIAVACDFRFSDETGKFGITPAKLGLVYSTPGTKNLVDLVGPAKAKDILFTGRLLDAEEALRIGLIDQLYSADELEPKTLAYAKMICENAQLSIRGSKRIIYEVLQGATEDSSDISQLVSDSFLSDDFKEGVNAFLEKRKPHFKYS